MSHGTTQLSPKFLQMIRGDFLGLLRHPYRDRYSYAGDYRLSRDLHALGGLLGEW